MRTGPSCLAALAVLILVCPSSVAGQDEESKLPDFSFSFLAFGDVYWVASHHQEESAGIVSAWLRRAYLTGDADFTKRLSGRLRFEINQGGDFEDDSFEIDYKDLLLAWQFNGGHKLTIGLQPTLTFDVIEKFWGLRYYERTPLDVQGIASRDTGLSFKGPLSKSGRLKYRLMYGAQLEFGSDSRDAGKYMAGLSWEPEPDWVVDFYLDFVDLPSESDRTTLQAFVGKGNSERRFSLQYSYQNRHQTTGINIASGVAVEKLADKLSLVGRFDRLFEPSIRGDDIPYLPMDPRAKATLWMLGVETRPHSILRVTPNVQVIRYDRIEDTGERPGTDVLLRLTLYVRI